MRSRATSRRRSGSRARSSPGRETAAEQLQRRSAFEADLPRIEGSDFSTTNDCQRHVSNPADPSPGAGCVNPPLGPNGPAFYPLYTTTTRADGSCMWQQGGANIPGTADTSEERRPLSTAAFCCRTIRRPGFTITQRYNNFQNDVFGNPCPAPGATGRVSGFLSSGAAAMGPRCSLLCVCFSRPGSGGVASARRRNDDPPDVRPAVEAVAQELGDSS